MYSWCVVFHWSVVDTLMVTFLKKTDLPPSGSYQLPTAPWVWMDLHTHLPLHMGICSDPPHKLKLCIYLFIYSVIFLSYITYQQQFPHALPPVAPFTTSSLLQTHGLSINQPGTSIKYGTTCYNKTRHHINAECGNPVGAKLFHKQKKESETGLSHWER